MVTRMRSFELPYCGYMKIPQLLGFYDLAFSRYQIVAFDIHSGVFERSTVYN